MRALGAMLSSCVLLFAGLAVQACGACGEISLGGDTFMDGYEPPEPSQDTDQDPVRDPQQDPSPMTTWARTYGTEHNERAFAVDQTFDGGFIVAGDTDAAGEGAMDWWVLKLDPEGNVQWQKAYGGSQDDMMGSIISTTDGGYALSGYSRSYGSGDYDLLVLKLDRNGGIAWQRAYGGESGEANTLGIRQTPDNGYVLAGLSGSFGDFNGWPVWLVKLDSVGEVQWQKIYGLDPYIDGGDLAITDEGDIVLALENMGGGPAHYVLAMLDPAGSVLWSSQFSATTYGAPTGPAAIQTAINGDILFAGTWTAGSGFTWCWVIRLTRDGLIKWSRTYARDSWDIYKAMAIGRTDRWGSIVAGYGPLGGGGNSFWLFELDDSGVILWEKAYGGSLWDRQGSSSRSVYQTSDRSFIVAGETDTYGAGGLDFWVIKTDSEGEIHDTCPENLCVETEAILTQDMPTITEAPLTVLDTNGAVTVTTITPSVTEAETALQCGG